MRLIKPLVIFSFSFLATIDVHAQSVSSREAEEYVVFLRDYKRKPVNDPYGISEDLLQRGVKKTDAPGQRMIRVGKTLTIAGSVLVVGGVALMATADEIFYTTTYTSDGGVEEEGDPQGGIGLAMTIGGVGMIIPGAIVWSKGKKKYEAYQSTGASISLGVNRNGLGLRFRF